MTRMCVPLILSGIFLFGCGEERRGGGESGSAGVAGSAGYGGFGGSAGFVGTGAVGGQAGIGGLGGTGATAGEGGQAGIGGEAGLGGEGGQAGSGGEAGLGGEGGQAGNGGDAGLGGEGGQGGQAGGGEGGNAGSGGSATVDPSPGCGNSTIASGNSTAMLTHDGRAREYMIHVPSSYTGTTPVPFVIDIHGLTSSDSAQAGLSGWRAKSDEVGFIVVHPQGLGNSWNGGDLCCGSSQSSGVDDEGFMRAIVSKISEQACINMKRVYATGLSNGGAMSHLLACNAADVFAATAPISMGNGTRPCTPSRPISVIMYRGTTDTLVGYNGGLFPSAMADFNQWKMLNGCTGSATKIHGVCDHFAPSQCQGGVEVTQCTLNAGHVLYSNAASSGVAVPDIVWEAFDRQYLP